jgi:hypothetical protein
MKIATITPMRYTPGELEYFQFIRGGVGADHHQGPTFHQFTDGTVRMVWWAYDIDECSPNSVVLYSDSHDRGLTWSDPQVYMADYPGGLIAPCVLLLHGGREAIMVLVKVRHRIEVDPVRKVVLTGWDYFQSRSRVFVRHSTDGGRTFDHGQEIPCQLITGGKELSGGGMYYGDVSVVQLQSGRIVVSGNFMDPTRSENRSGIGHFVGVCLLSDDGGRTWRRSAEITVDTPRGVMEMQIAEVEPNHLFCLFRNTSGYLCQTHSEDGGETWSKPERSPLPSPESMPRMIKLQSGNLLLVWNNVSSTTQQPRHPLSAVLSRDGGCTWGTPKVIADELGENQVSNHGMIQLDDGRILLAINHYRAVHPTTSDLDMAIFDETWLHEEYPLPLVWRFRTDPANRGEAEQWYAVQPDASWSEIRTDSDWVSQGYRYYGTAWYSVGFTCPDELAGKEVILHFGAVDGICQVWLDAQYIGSQLEPPDVMWNKPFTLPIGRLEPNREHRLVVRVTKDRLAAGIWKPVALKER